MRVNQKVRISNGEYRKRFQTLIPNIIKNLANYTYTLDPFAACMDSIFN